MRNPHPHHLALLLFWIDREVCYGLLSTVGVPHKTHSGGGGVALLVVRQ
jgi:hypothetical protein